MPLNYGVPYMGSKNRLLPGLLEQLPPANTFVDLFAGGCSVAHAAMLSGRYNNFTVNDIGMGPDLFINAINGKYHDEKRWISRDDFNSLKDIDPYIKYCWSFGNQGTTYLYGKKIEEYKKALHYQRVLGDDTLILKTNTDGVSKRQQKELESDERLRRLQSLESLRRLQRDYRDIDFPEDCVVYCDPPYYGTAKYDDKNFNHEDFYEWCEEQRAPLFISEYDMPDDRFKCVWSKDRVTSLGPNKKTIERLYRPIHQIDN